jgi:hypothetical protein
MRMTAADQLALGVIDGVIDEPAEGAHQDPAAAARAIKAAILASLGRISRLDPETLLATRYARLRAIGHVRETDASSPYRPEASTIRGRIGRLLRLPGVPRRPRWSEIWPSGDDGGDGEGEA